jgi:conjugal transfer pilus assembly protein TraA
MAQISDYMQGSLGKVLIGLIVLVGLAAAVVRQSLMSLAVAVGGAISRTTHRTLSMA